MNIDDAVTAALAANRIDDARVVYRRAVAEHRASAAMARFAIAIVYVALLGLFGVGGAIGLVRSYETRVELGKLDGEVMYKSERKALDQAEVIADIGVIKSGVNLIAAIALVVVTLRSRGRFASRLQDQACNEVAPGAMPSLRAFIGSLCRDMGVSAKITLLVPTRTRGVAPSVYVSGVNLSLVVPPRLAVLAAKRPEVARAMLVHELAHVVQGDSGFWSLAVAFATSVKRVLGPLLWISVVGAAAMLVPILMIAGDAEGSGSPMTLIIMLGLVVPACALLCIRWVLRLRLRSEQLADTAALVYGEPRGLRAATELLLDLGTADPWHESPDVRAFRAKLAEDAVSRAARSA